MNGTDQRLLFYYVLLADLYMKICPNLILIFSFEQGCVALLYRYITVNREKGIIYVLDRVEHVQASLQCCSTNVALRESSS